jgi:hypothetical protein
MIAFVDRYDHPTLRFAEAEGSRRSAIALPPETGYVSGLQWSPDGRALAVLAGERSEVLRLVDARTGAIRRIGRPVSYAGDLRWLPA